MYHACVLNDLVLHIIVSLEVWCKGLYILYVFFLLLNKLKSSCCHHKSLLGLT